tara:strand:- start:301 stop:447 length:147 start_codon:yes stop_codon:yes gene_type:complete
MVYVPYLLKLGAAEKPSLPYASPKLILIYTISRTLKISVARLRRVAMS